jgi:ABC-type multidrug transport system fused ATPase/permease subunit
MSITRSLRWLAVVSADKLPGGIFAYVLATSGAHQLLLLVLTVSVFLLEIVPLELQRRIADDLVKNRPYRWVVALCAIYAGVVLVQGGTKLVLNVYRGWVGERALRDLRRRIHTVIEAPASTSPAAEAQGIAVSMIVAEVEPIGGFVGESVSEPLLQGGILASVLAYLIHIDPWMALGAFALFVPQFLFVPLMQAAVNRRAGSRIRILRQLGINVIDQNNGHFRADDQRIDRVFALDMGIFKLKFTMNFLMNLCSHLQIVSALLIGGWWVYTDRLEIGGIVAFISGISRLNDPWGDLVNYFRDVTVNQVKYRLLANAVNELAREPPELAKSAAHPASQDKMATALSE